MKIINEWEISPGLKIAEVEHFPEAVFQKLVSENLLTDAPALNWRGRLNEVEMAQDHSLRENLKNIYRLRLALLSGESIVGFTLGWQTSLEHSDFYMAISVVEDAFRKRGFYGQLLEKVLLLTREKGFAAVVSRHLSTNNPVIIAKLKKGFIINGLEIDETMGSLLKMTYYHNPDRRRAADFRSGKIAGNPTGDLLMTDSKKP